MACDGALLTGGQHWEECPGKGSSRMHAHQHQLHVILHLNSCKEHFKIKITLARASTGVYDQPGNTYLDI